MLLWCRMRSTDVSLLRELFHVRLNDKRTYGFNRNLIAYLYKCISSRRSVNELESDFIDVLHYI